MNHKIEIRSVCAIIALLGGFALSIISLFTPPCGEIAESVIFATAQFLIFSGSCLGIDVMIEKKISEKK